MLGYLRVCGLLRVLFAVAKWCGVVCLVWVLIVYVNSVGVRDSYMFMFACWFLMLIGLIGCFYYGVFGFGVGVLGMWFV